MSPKQIAAMLKARREEKGLTQTGLAKRAKVSQAYVASIEAGARKNPSLAVLQKLAKALGVSVTELLG